MKNIIYTIVLFSYSSLALANNITEIDTIQANEKMTIALFFPSDIRQAITGAEHVIFNYNRETGQNLGLLKAMPGPVSNLLVITTDGEVYSFFISYGSELQQLNYFIGSGQSIGNEKEHVHASPKLTRNLDPSLVDTSNPVSQVQNTVSKPLLSKEDLQKTCETLLTLPERKRITKTKKGISLGIRNLVYYKDKVYLQMEIKNKSGIDFDINTLSIAKIQGNKNRKASFQKTVMDSIYTHALPEKVRHGSTGRFVVVMPKFTLGDREKMSIHLWEHNGNRTVTLACK